MSRAARQSIQTRARAWVSVIGHLLCHRRVRQPPYATSARGRGVNGVRKRGRRRASGGGRRCAGGRGRDRASRSRETSRASRRLLLPFMRSRAAPKVVGQSQDRVADLPQSLQMRYGARDLPPLHGRRVLRLLPLEVVAAPLVRFARRPRHRRVVPGEGDARTGEKLTARDAHQPKSSPRRPVPVARVIEITSQLSIRFTIGVAPEHGGARHWGGGAAAASRWSDCGASAPWSRRQAPQKACLWPLIFPIADRERRRQSGRLAPLSFSPGGRVSSPWFRVRGIGGRAAG